MSAAVPETGLSSTHVGLAWPWMIGLPLAASVLVILLATGGLHRSAPIVAIATAPATISSAGLDARAGHESAPGVTAEVTMGEMLTLAETALAATIANLNDYTARLVKQEQDQNGVLQPASESFLKVRTRHQDGQTGGPLSVYMRFDSPAPIKGREVIWVENENDGNLLVREAGMIGAMGTLRLPPSGFLAMRGQRYPITEIGLTRLLEKLIERGQPDRENPDVRVFKTEGRMFDGRPLTQLQIQRARPSGKEGDFSLAELFLDRPNNLVVSFRSFGWPDPGADNADRSPAPLIESYEYYDLKLNVGLSDQDFDPSNPAYTFAE